ncbi:uncharacterized protein LOC135940515 [Cloeon dipterum]|uniref:uncharacterized protein LOC135940515 n=1 Tax=Cloeon dipterum TaxID=197152 RepID=UPI0032205CA8
MMGLLDRRLLFSCFLVGIVAIIFLQGAEARSRRSIDGRMVFDRYNIRLTSGGHHGSYYRGSEKMQWSWLRFILIILSLFGIGIFGVLAYFYCCYDHNPEINKDAARVANFLKHQEEQRNRGLSTIVHQPVTYRSPDNKPPSAPAMTQQPKRRMSDVPSFAPPDFASATAPLLPPGVQPVDSSTYPPPGEPTLSSSATHMTSPQNGFIIPPQDPANASVHFGGRVEVV